MSTKNKNKYYKPVIHIPVDRELHAELLELSEKFDLPLTILVRKLLRYCLANIKKEDENEINQNDNIKKD